ncbi:MAG: plasmid pRiA4b ORF-3 family protein [Clostridiales bacterium]|nr:plasmid pRiA4b ORF-3 family protein [Clostridiales bacterium]
MKAYQIKIELDGARSPIWRRCFVPAGITFSQLGILLNEMMGWSGYHMFSFSFPSMDVMIKENPTSIFGNRDIRDSTRIIIDEFLDKEERFNYIYDFGDDWFHKLTVEMIMDDYPLNYPKVIEYSGDCPIEDSGGIDGYYEILEILEKPSHPDYENIKRWVDINYPGEYDVEEVNELLRNFYYCKRGIMDTRTASDIYMAFFDGEEGLITSKYKKGSEKKKQVKVLENVSPYHDLEEESLEEDKQLEDFEKELLYLMKIHKETNPYKYVPKKLHEVFLSNYTRDELYEIAKFQNLPRRSTYNKTELAIALSKYMLSEKVMENFIIFLDDDEIEFLEFAFLKGYLNPFEMPSLEHMQALYTVYNFALIGGYLCLDNDDVIIAPTDVIELYKSINTEELHAKRKKIISPLKRK